jgi:UDP-N-acetylmuramoyl-tripeptide--D-alanyl-D-alanine ligase
MRNKIKHKLQSFLAWSARRILAKYHPKIIGITGSVGKTSTKEAIFGVVSQKFRTRKSEKNYNNEFGLPLTIIGASSSEKGIAGWLAAVGKALFLILFSQKYPQVLVLEMGIDRPGDMDYLLSLTGEPDIAVVTTIGMSHYEFFSDPGEIETEKGKLIAAVKSEGTAILNADNEASLRQKSKTSAKVVTYGASSDADVALQNLSENLEGKFYSHLVIKLASGEFEANIAAIGGTHISAVLAAVAVGQALGIEESLLKVGLQNYRPAPGRLNIIAGIKHSVIIDDSYNAAPDSVKEALAVLARMPNSHKIAVLGNMLELGAVSDSAHEAMGRETAKLGLDHLITVGDEAKLLADAAHSSGMAEDKILKFDTSDEARKTVQNLLKPESVILVKGSQAIRTEKIVKEIMAEPMRASELLCRQYGSWLRS